MRYRVALDFDDFLGVVENVGNVTNATTSGSWRHEVKRPHPLHQYLTKVSADFELTAGILTAETKQSSRVFDPVVSSC